jgi:CheY-like chemotaxis protein
MRLDGQRCIGRLTRLGVRPGASPELAARIATANVALGLGLVSAMGICALGALNGLWESALAGATLPPFMIIGLLAMARGRHRFARVWLTVSASATVLLVARVADPQLVIAVPFILAVLPLLVLLPEERRGLRISMLAASVAALGVFWSGDLTSMPHVVGALTSTIAFGVLLAIQRANAQARDADLQALRAAKERADDAAAARSLFLANMSHELRTPLGAVIGYGDLLADPKLEAAERRDLVGVLRRNAAHLIEVVNQIPTSKAIDDEADIRLIGSLSLTEVGGWRVLEAPSGAEGVVLAASEPPDVVLLDVMMPGLDGPRTLELLRADPRTRSVPVIFMTARAQKHETEAFLALGAAGVIHKPFDPMTLPDEIRRLVESRC